MFSVGRELMFAGLESLIRIANHIVSNGDYIISVVDYVISAAD